MLSTLDSPFLRPEIPRIQEVTPPSVHPQKGPRKTVFHLVRVDEKSHKAYFSAIRKTLKSWMDVLGERVGISRQLASQGKLDATADLDLWKNCQELKFYITAHVEKLEKGQALQNEGMLSISLLMDDQKNIQTICTTTLQINQLYINVILSAPWNIKMESPVPAPHDQMAVARAGTTMIRAMYEFAQEAKVPQLRLKPLPNSYDFYKQHCAMSEDVKKGEFFYNVALDSVPEKIREIVIPTII